MKALLMARHTALEDVEDAVAQIQNKEGSPLWRPLKGGVAEIMKKIVRRSARLPHGREVHAEKVNF